MMVRRLFVPDVLWMRLTRGVDCRVVRWLSVPKTLSELMTRRNQLFCWNDRADPICARRPGIAHQVEESA